MGEQFRSLIDVTIVYPGGAPTFWQYACGRVPKIVLRAQQLPIPQEFCSADYAADSDFRREFHRWLTTLWERKDAQIDSLLRAA